MIIVYLSYFVLGAMLGFFCAAILAGRQDERSLKAISESIEKTAKNFESQYSGKVTPNKYMVAWMDMDLGIIMSGRPIDGNKIVDTFSEALAYIPEVIDDETYVAILDDSARVVAHGYGDKEPLTVRIPAKLEMS